MFEKVKVKQINSHVYLFDEEEFTSGYLVVGEEKAAVIDTMNGEEDLHAIVRTITDLPIIVLNTHGHGDHIGGNAVFEEMWIHEADLPMVEGYVTHPDVVKYLKKHKLKAPKVHTFRHGDVFDLGGLTLEAIHLPGHTEGSAIFLLKEDRMLFTGDAVNRHLWLQLDGCMTPAEYLVQVEKVMYLKDEADIILHGHTRGTDPISLLSDFREGLQEIADGKTENDKPYEWFCGVDKQHIYGPDNNVICYK